MVFQVPKYRLKDSMWFISDKETVLYGQVKLITLAISEEQTNVYYSVDVNGSAFTVVEGNVVDNYTTLPKPKYAVGEEVMFKFHTKDGKEGMTSDIVERVDICVYDKGQYEINYYLQGDADYWILEDEIIDKLQDCPLLVATK